MRQPDRTGRTRRGGVFGLPLALVLMCGAVVATAGWMKVRRWRVEFQVLRGRVERAAAPGEPVVVTDRALRWMLVRFGSESLREEIVPSADGDTVTSLLRAHPEVVVVTGGDGALVRYLHERGFDVQRQGDEGSEQVYFVSMQIR